MLKGCCTLSALSAERQKQRHMHAWERMTLLLYESRRSDVQLVVEREATSMWRSLILATGLADQCTSHEHGISGRRQHLAINSLEYGTQRSASNAERAFAANE